MGKKKPVQKNVRPISTSEQEPEHQPAIILPPPPQPLVAQLGPMVPLSVLTALLQASNPNADWSKTLALLNLPGTVPASGVAPAQTAVQPPEEPTHTTVETAVTASAEPSLVEKSPNSPETTAEPSTSVPQTEDEEPEGNTPEENESEEKLPQETEALQTGDGPSNEEGDQVSEAENTPEPAEEEVATELGAEEFHTGDHPSASAEDERLRAEEEPQLMLDEAQTEETEAAGVAEGLGLAFPASETQEVQDPVEEEPASPTQAELKTKKKKYKKVRKNFISRRKYLRRQARRAEQKAVGAEKPVDISSSSEEEKETSGTQTILIDQEEKIETEIPTTEVHAVDPPSTQEDTLISSPTKPEESLTAPEEPFGDEREASMKNRRLPKLTRRAWKERGKANK